MTNSTHTHTHPTNEIHTKIYAHTFHTIHISDRVRKRKILNIRLYMTRQIGTTQTQTSRTKHAGTDI